MPFLVSWQPWAYSVPTATGYNLADLGGLNDTAPNWPAFIEQYAAEWHPYLEAIRASIVQRGVWAGGDWHQESPHGMPMVEGHYWSSTWRTWGDLLAAVWNTELGQQFTYMDFYMDVRLPPKPAAWA